MDAYCGENSMPVLTIASYNSGEASSIVEIEAGQLPWCGYRCLLIGGRLAGVRPGLVPKATCPGYTGYSSILAIGRQFPELSQLYLRCSQQR